MPDPFAIYEPRNTEVAALVNYADGYLGEEHEIRVTVTRFPLESGAQLMDHAVHEPDLLKLNGWTSDLFPSDPANISDADRPARAWAEIRRMADERTPLQVVTILGVYNSMVLTRATAPVGTRTGRGLLFTLEFQEVQTEPLRRVEFVLTPAPAGPAADRVGDTNVTEAHSFELTEVIPQLDPSDPLSSIIESGLQIGNIAASTWQNVVQTVSEGDLSGAAGALGEGLSEVGDVIGDAIRLVRAPPEERTETGFFDDPTLGN